MPPRLTACLPTLAPDPFAITPDDADELIAAAAAAGFDAVSMFGFVHSAMSAPDDPDRTARALERHGLGVTMVEACLGWVHGSEQAEEDAVPLLDLAVRSGAPLVGAVVMTPDLPAGREAAVAGLRRVADLAADRDVTVAVEFLPWSALPDLRALGGLLDEVGRPNVGVNLDTWHWFRRPGGPDPTQLDEVAADRIVVLQLEDVATVAEPDPLEECMHRRPLPGRGAADLVPLLAELRRRGADPAVMPEVFNDELAALGPVAAAAAMHAATVEVLDAAGW